MCASYVRYLVAHVIIVRGGIVLLEEKNATRFELHDATVSND